MIPSKAWFDAESRDQSLCPTRFLFRLMRRGMGSNTSSEWTGGDPDLFQIHLTCLVPNGCPRFLGLCFVPEGEGNGRPGNPSDPQTLSCRTVRRRKVNRNERPTDLVLPLRRDVFLFWGETSSRVRFGTNGSNHVGPRLHDGRMHPCRSPYRQNLLPRTSLRSLDPVSLSPLLAFFPV